MPVIIYGSREYGRVEAHAGEHASTRFFHIWFAPLFPMHSTWHTGPRPDGTRGHLIKLHARSVAAAYLRIWAPIVAIGCFSAAFATHRGASGVELGPLIAAIVLAGLSAWSWTWRSLRGAAAQRRSDFNFVAFGTRCEPHRLDPLQRLAAKRDLDRRWAELSPAHTPNEAATHGAASAAEAVLAYGLLRLSAIERGRDGASDGADADRILAGRFDAPDVTDGPYRAGPAAAGDAATQAALAALVDQRAAEASRFAATGAAFDRDVERARRKRRSRLQAFGLVFLSMAAVGGVLGFAASMRSTLDVGLKELRSVKPPHGRAVRVTCDEVQPPLWEETTQHGDVTSRIAMCALGKYLLPVKLGAQGAIPPHVLEGKLADVDRKLLWVRQGLSLDAQLEARTLDVYLDTTRMNDDVIAGGVGLGLAALTPVLWVLWFRARRRRLAAERAATSS